MSQEPHRNEQTSAAPCFSPGPVQSYEFVLRTLLDPDHINDDGTLKPAAIALEDIHKRGWSVDRTGFTSPWRIKLFHYRWKKRKPDIRRFYVLRIPVSDIRNIRDGTTNRQEFAVIDTASFLSPAHAEVLLSTGGSYSKSVLRSFRTKLIPKLPTRIELSEAFDHTEKCGVARGILRQLGAILRSPFRCLRQLVLSATGHSHNP